MEATKNRWQNFRKQIDLALIAILIISALAHSINMFGFPSYREDEGTYMSQAWSLIKEVKLAPYTYWYDHAPAGWFLIAAWELGGGTLVKGLAVDSGRVLMLILQIISTFLIYRIAFRITNRRGTAIIASLFFALAPLAIIFQRRIYLDNIMVFWLLLSFYFLSRPSRLHNHVASAFFFAIAALTKESAVALIPLMFLAVLYNSYREHRKFALVAWGSVAFLIIAVYPLFALLKGEFFPTGTLLGGTAPHVSLIDAIRFQYNRNGASAFFLDQNSLFMYAVKTAFSRYGPLFLLFGLISSAVNLIFYRSKWSLIMGLASLSYIAFTLRAQVFDWYIIPLAPLFALNIGMTYNNFAGYFQKTASRPWLFRYFYAALCTFVLAFELAQNNYIFWLNQTQNQRDAVAWIKQNIKSNSIVMIDNYAFSDLNPKVGDITKASDQYYWKADTDPEIKYNLLNNDWNNIDYLLFTPAMTITINNDNLGLIKNAYADSNVIKRFHANDILGEGYPVEIREVNNKTSIVRESWQYYKDKFITADGRVVDPQHGNQTTSEGQSYALLRAVWLWEGDRETFDRVLNWTQNNMSLPDNLFSWRYSQTADGTFAITDRATATDADEDIALALLFASKRWDNPDYLAQANKIISNLWNDRVKKINNLYYLDSGAVSSQGLLINPSYFAPASYRIFAEVDPAHDWKQLADDTYAVLADLTDKGLIDKNTNLPPDWFGVKDNGQYFSATAVKARANEYGYDAFRLNWRVALDNIWFNTPQATAYLKSVSPFFEKQLASRGQVDARYSLAGANLVSYSDISTNTGPLSALLVTDPVTAIDLYSNFFWPEYKNGFWGDPDNYYNQNWAWFGSALYANNLLDFWHHPVSSPPPQ